MINLTPKELEVVRLMRQGLKNHEIASLLFMSKESVEKLVNNLYQKTETVNGKHFIDWCWRNDILKKNTENIPSKEDEAA
jgi:DNA-binding NarL/FixJ family response regulator